MGSKKSQISMFIVIAIIVIIMIIFIFSTDFGSKEDDLNFNDAILLDDGLNVETIKNYIDFCLKESVELGVYYLANNGGYIYEYEDVLFTEYNQIAKYGIGNNFHNSINDDFMKQELSRFITSRLYLCVEEYKLQYDYINISYDNSQIEIEFKENSVDVKTRFPIVIFKDGIYESISFFRVEVPIRFKHILDIRDELLESYDNTLLDFDDFVGYDVQINILPFDRNTLIYSIYDQLSNIQNSKFIFNFVVESDLNSPPEFNFIPNFKLNVNSEFKYNLSAIDLDNDNLIYYSNSSQLNITSDTGELSFLCENIGTYNFDVCVKDEISFTCENILFKVVDEK